MGIKTIVGLTEETPRAPSGRQGFRDLNALLDPIAGYRSSPVYPWQPNSPTTRKSAPISPQNNTGYWGLGWQWATGTGPGRQVFTQNDPATQMLMQHDNFDRMRTWVRKNGAGKIGKPLRWDNNLGGIGGTLAYLGQYSSLASHGYAGNLAATYLGSYNTEFKIKDIDKNGYATVDVHVWNDSDLKSATHPPVIGYTKWWQKSVEPTIMAAQPKSGPFSPKHQDFYWQEKIKIHP